MKTKACTKKSKLTQYIIYTARTVSDKELISVFLLFCIIHCLLLEVLIKSIIPQCEQLCDVFSNKNRNVPHRTRVML